MRGEVDKILTKDLDLVRMLRKSREQQGLMWALTTRSQRRMARWQARYIARMKSENDFEVSSSGEGSTGSERDFEPRFAARQLDCVKENPSQFNLRLLRGMIGLPRFNPRKVQADEFDQYKVKSHMLIYED